MNLKYDKSIRIQFLFVLFIIIVSCSHHNPSLKAQENNVIVGRSVNLEGVFSAFDIAIIDSLMIVQEFGNKFNFTVFNKHTLKRLGGFGRSGRGLGEYTVPIMMNQKIIKNDSIYLIVFDLNLSRIDSINILKAINTINYNPEKINFRNKKLAKTYPTHSAVIASDSFLVGTIRVRLLEAKIEGKFFCWDIYNDNLTWEPFYPIPKIKPKDRMLDVLYESFLALRPDNQEIVSVSRYFERIDILDKKGKLNRSIIFENKDKEPDFSNANRVPPKGAQQYFYSVAVTQDLIFALNLDWCYDNGISPDTVTLVKSSWDSTGNRPDIFKLTPRVSKIAIDKENNRLFGVKQMSSEVYVFDLK